ncbi:concanavalin A-like lectin/glucanase domain-containing protein [Lentinula raphanica]|uniref:Concanavalin A-like lectin/glucanase domain-containing protein n=1 Tax=Lentinula raphanica TaxID=153919 RepID=A0AA38U5X2_9AGAR|nr:concanavalin A-like lectin/glucanase domain-containing protein [Lentinula raphanica]
MVMTTPSLALILQFLIHLTTTSAQTYTLSQNLSGSNFLSGFKYNESLIDYNNFGNVHFLSQSDAVSNNLTYVDTNGHVIIKVDNTTDANGDTTFGRNSVYLESNNAMTIGSLLVLDAVHIPYGCSVWPSLFTQGQDWPTNGEIDLVENVNLATTNQYSLHAGSSSCVQSSSATSNQTGTTTSTNCTVVPSEDENTGCVVEDNQSNSFGAGFAENNGGVYAVLWDDSGIAMWFFNRSSIPSDLSSAEPDPSSWSTASAWYPASGCSPTSAFGAQTITLYIDICGAFAGDTTVFDETCSSVASNCTSLVQTASNYDNAYWEINYLRVFTTGSSSTNSSSSGSSNNAYAASVFSSSLFLVVAMISLMSFTIL